MAQQGYGGQGYPASQLGAAASGSGSTTPASGATRSGRVVKPVKPYTAPVQPARGSSARVMQGGAARSLVGGGHANAAVPTGPPPPPQRHPLALTLSAVPPMTRITGPGNEAKQAIFTTYPARMRLGMSTLMQPNAFAAAAPASAATSNGTSAGAGGASGTGGANTPVVPGKRQRTTINYADFENLDDLLDGDEDDDHHPNNNNNARARRGQSSTPAAQQVRGKVAATPAAAPPKPEYWGDGKSYLGALPPGNLVQVQPVKTTKHLAL